MNVLKSKQQPTSKAFQISFLSTSEFSYVGKP